ncbi:hypothetical protein COI53_25690 [Bacillus thuringiensis]|uniref:hypothetical protein n=1 Tax=Bacillus thuringiensis TaxID=1428 RepID=UPI000BF2751D|nr:hypothetical protein [Bacillus thuringiensis]PFI27090.1 hypothetical protein COI53_25690 [Bacillus thuringiensis]
MSVYSSRLKDFYELSMSLTGVSIYELQGTGVGEKYFVTVKNIVGEEIFFNLLKIFRKIGRECNDKIHYFDQKLRIYILSDPMFGPVARNIIKMWYLGSWFQLPDVWREEYYINNSNDVTHVISNESYVEGLVWKVIESHPMGAKQPGYGTWSLPFKHHNK